MGIIAQDNFNSYTAGSSIIGQNGGTGFTGAYTGNGGTIGNAISGNVNKINTSNSSTDSINRTFSFPVSGKIKFQAYINRNTLNDSTFIGFILGGNEYRFVFIPGFGNQLRYNGVTVGATDPFTTAGIFYKINITVDTTTTVNNVIFEVNNVSIGTFSTTITNTANPFFVQSVSGFTAGLRFTEISFDDLVTTSFLPRFISG